MLRLNLGCSDSHIQGFVNVDRCAPADQIVDLRLTWPWEDSSVDYIRAWDIIEHLPDKIHTMNEIHRVLKPGGTVEIVVPTTDGRGADQDPTHCSYWNRNSFYYHEAGNPHLERFREAYGMRGGFRVMAEKQETIADSVVKLAIVLQAVKTERPEDAGMLLRETERQMEVENKAKSLRPNEAAQPQDSGSANDQIDELIQENKKRPLFQDEQRFAFSILHSSARPNEWRKVYDAWLSAAAHPEQVEYVLCVDFRWGFQGHDQMVSADLVNWKAGRPGNKIVINTGRRCYVDGVNLAAAASSGDVLIVNADDQYPCDKWDERLTVHLQYNANGSMPATLKDFVIEVSTNTPDEHSKGIHVMPILSRERYERFGWVFFPGYESMWADNDFCAMAKRDHCIIDARHLTFPHKHYLNGERSIDEADIAHANEQVYNRGERLFNARKAINFAGIPPETESPAVADTTIPLILVATPGNMFSGVWLDAWTKLFGYMVPKYNLSTLRMYTSNAAIVRTVMARHFLGMDYGVPADYVLWIDDDNTLEPTQLEMLLADLREHPEYDAVVGWCWTGADDNLEIGRATISCGQLIDIEATTDGNNDVAFAKIRQITPKEMYESPTDLIEIGYSGFPVVLMRFDLLKKVGKELFTPFTGARCEHGVSGEDIAFFARATIRSGARYAVDRRVKVPHLKLRPIEPIPTFEQIEEARRKTVEHLAMK